MWQMCPNSTSPLCLELIHLRRYQAYTLAPFTGTLVSLFQEIQIKMMPRGYFKS